MNMYLTQPIYENHKNFFREKQRKLFEEKEKYFLVIVVLITCLKYSPKKESLIDFLERSLKHYFVHFQKCRLKN